MATKPLVPDSPNEPDAEPAGSTGFGVADTAVGLPEAATAQTLAALPEAATAQTLAALPDDSAAGPVRVDGFVQQASVRGAGATPSDAARYEIGRVLGEGGMGEVRLVRDTRIGREVAAKFIRDTYLGRTDLVVRFEREARIQGQLEHPAIVPVYDFDITPSGAPFFTMKRVRGDTLEHLMGCLRAGDPSVSRRKLLQALGQVCLAMEYAHERGALHRDLKTENIMLGPYGEVYVLDWGIANVAADPADRAATGSDEARTGLSASGALTALGAVSGTLGYMAPEHLRGDALDARADVYALGVILFELLTLERFIQPGPAEEMMRRAKAGVDSSPARRAPARGVPADLDALCQKATAFAKADRLPSARALHDGIESHLDGDRDRSRRRELADAHARAARAALGPLRGDGLRTAARAPRDTAIREASQALTLDPVHEDARDLMRELLMFPSEDLPAEAEAELERRLLASHDAGRKIGLAVYALWLLLVPAIWWAGIRDPFLLAVFVALMLTLVALEAGFPVRMQSGPRLAMIVVCISTGALACLSTLFGPLVLIPGWAAANGMTYTTIFAKRWQRALAVGLSLSAIVVPLALELTGILPPSYGFQDGLLVIHPKLMHFTSPAATLALLAVLNLLIVSIPLSLAGQLGIQERRRERQLFVHSWNLQHLVPEAAREAAGPKTAPSPPDAG